mgnify:FL=1
MSDQLAQLVKQARTDQRISQATLSEKSGLCLATVRRIEKGLPARPESLSSLAQALGIPFAEIAQAAEWSGPAPQMDPEPTPPPLDRRAPEEELEFTITVRGNFLRKLLEAIQKQ